MSNINKDLPTKGYMELAFHVDGQDALILRVPTLWDDIEKQWIGVIKTPTTKRVIYATGKNSVDLQNSFNRILKESLGNPSINEEIFSMFQPASFWEDNEL